MNPPEVLKGLIVLTAGLKWWQDGIPGKERALLHLESHQGEHFPRSQKVKIGKS